MTEPWSVGAGLEGKRVLITGAAGGIGRELVACFVAAGADVLATDRDLQGLRTALESVTAADVELHAADLADLAQHDELLDRVERTGPLFALVHCAAVLRRRSDITQITEEDWDQQVDVNLKATFFLCRAAAERMRSAGTAGRIITFSSQAWWTGGFGGSIVYASTKGGIVSMTRGLARTYGPSGITVNAVSPGQARTEMLLSGLDDKVLQAMTDQTPLGRIAEPAEVASAAVFLASRHASFITGSTLNVSGGFLMY